MPATAAKSSARATRLKASPCAAEYNGSEPDPGPYAQFPFVFRDLLFDKRTVDNGPKRKWAKRKRSAVDGPLPRALMLFLGYEWWGGPVPKKGRPAWTRAFLNAELADMLDVTAKAIAETVDDLVARGVILADKDGRGYRYAANIQNWSNVQPRPEPEPVLVPDPPEEPTSEEASEPEEQGRNPRLLPSRAPAAEGRNERVLPSRISNRLILLGRDFRTLQLSDAVRTSGKAEIQNEIEAAQVETWEQSGVFHCKVSLTEQKAKLKINLPAPAAATTREIAKADPEQSEKLRLYEAWVEERKQCPKPINVAGNAACKPLFLSFPLSVCERIVSDTEIRKEDWNRPRKNLDFVPSGLKYLQSGIWDTDPVQRVKGPADKKRDWHEELRRKAREADAAAGRKS